MKNFTTNSTMCFTTIDPNKDISKNEASACEIETCKQNVRQREDFMHSNFQMDISLPWIVNFSNHFQWN